MSNCKGCGREIIWGVTEDGKKIPLDPMAPVYEVRKEKLGYAVAKIQHFNLSPDYMVTHFSTCSKASQFSKANKNKITPKEKQDAKANVDP